LLQSNADLAEDMFDDADNDILSSCLVDDATMMIETKKIKKAVTIETSTKVISFHCILLFLLLFKNK